MVDQMVLILVFGGSRGNLGLGLGLTVIKAISTKICEDSYGMFCYWSTDEVITECTRQCIVKPEKLEFKAYCDHASDHECQYSYSEYCQYIEDCTNVEIPVDATVEEDENLNEEDNKVAVTISYAIAGAAAGVALIGVVALATYNFMKKRSEVQDVADEAAFQGQELITGLEIGQTMSLEMMHQMSY